ncbi:tyrosine-type recombinase/integrase [bacterium]|nr:tyrosine-type recombinase/integrase [candidate division CSSED10-310 bacterium]
MVIGEYGKITPEEARRKARKILADADDGHDPLREKQESRQILTFSDWVDQYLEQVKLQKKHPREDIRYLGQTVELWGNLPLPEIKTEDIRKEFMKRVNTGKRSAANRWLASVRACLQAAWREDLLDINPAMKVKPTSEPAPRKRVLSDAEFKRLIDAIDQLPDLHARAAFRLLVETGARLSEVLHAKWTDLDFDNALWNVPSPKSGKPQVIPLLSEIVDMLKDIPRSSVYVIAGRIQDNPRHDLKKPWKFLLEAAKLEGVTIHDLRRTFGLQVTRSSGLHIASKLLRHSDIRVTERHYAPLDIEEQRKALVRRKSTGK